MSPVFSVLPSVLPSFSFLAKLQKIAKNRTFGSFASFAERILKNLDFVGKTKNGYTFIKNRLYRNSFSFAELAKLLKKPSESSFAEGYIYLKIYIYPPAAKLTGDSPAFLANLTI